MSTTPCPSTPPQAWGPYLDLLPVGVILTGRDGQCLEANTAASKILDLPLEVLRDTRWPDPQANLLTPSGARLTPEDMPRAEALRQGKAVPRQTVGLVKTDGHVQWLRVSAEPLPEGQVLVTVEDVTEQRVVEERLAFAQRAARAGLWEWDLRTGQFTWSPELFELYGMDPSREQATIETWTRILHPDDLSITQNQTAQMLADLKPFNGEYRIILPDGQIRWIRAQGSFDLDDQGQPLRLAGLCTDHTQQKAIERALAASESQAQLMLSTARDGVWLLDHQGRFKVVNEAAAHMLGGTVEALLSRKVADFEVLESPDEVVRHIERIICQGWDFFETRLHRMDGTELLAEVSVTHQSELDQMVVFVRDITERKRAELALVESEAKLRAIISHSRDAIGVSREGLHVMVNPAYLAMFGFDPGEDLAGKPIFDLIAPEYRDQVTRYAQDRMAGKPVPMTYEVRGCRQDQTTFDMEIQASTYDLSGSTHTLVIIRDISERNRKETDLMASEARFRTMFEGSPIGIWEEDFSAVKAHFDGLRQAGVADLRAHLAEHPQELIQMAGLVRILSINQASLRSLKAASEAEIVRNLPNYFTAESYAMFKEGLIALFDGETHFTIEGPHLDAHGQPLIFEISYAVVPGQEVSLSRVLVSFVDISERKHIETALRHSELATREALHFSESLLSTMPIGATVYEVASGHCILANQAMAHQLGARRDELLSQNFREIDSWKASGILDVAERVIASDHKERAEFRIRSTFGKDIWMSCEFSTFSSVEGKHLLALATDISERKAADLALSRSERQFRGLFESMREGFALHEIITDEAGQPVDYRFLDVNPAFEAMTGIARDQWIGRTILEVQPDIEARWIREYGAVALTGQAVTFEDEAKGLGRTYRVTAYRPAPGQFAVLVSDVSEQKRAEDDRHRLEQHLARTQKMESLGSLAGGVAHDMNNVLGAIMGLASIHQEQAPEDSRLHKSMDTILRACTRGRTLVKGLLGFARQGLEEVRVLDLNETVREECALLERTIPAGVRIQLDLCHDLRSIHGDPASLSHVLMNLCVNAVDAMPTGGTLSLRTRNLGPDSVWLEVADTGCGMPPEVLEKALDPFFTTKGQGKGTGLGLAIVYGTVKAHHGRLELLSTPGVGTQVQLTFPATVERAEPTLPGSADSCVRRQLRVLVIDDDELIQDSLSELLQSLGHLPTIASSGEEALWLLEQGLVVDAAMLDLNMPGLGGAGTLPLLRAGHPDLPVLLATGRADQDAMDLVARTSRTILLPKPFSGEEISSHFLLLGLG